MSYPCRVFESRKCEITQWFSDKHQGMDLVNENYTEGWVVAHSDGVVVDRRVDCKGFEEGGSYGNYVKIKHKDNYFTFYAHLRWDTVQVDVGQEVKQGDLLGFQGETGTAYGSHLHFEVRTSDDVRINPDPYLNANLPNMIPITPNVERDKNKNQVEVLYDDLRVRTEPNLNGDVLGFANIGFYDVIEKSESDGYTWFKIGDKNYIAYSTDWAKYYPSENIDYKKLYMEAIKEIEKLNDKINKAIEDLS